MRTLVNVKTDLDKILGPKTLLTIWTWNKKCSRRMKTKNFGWHKTWQWERQTLSCFFDWRTSWLLRSETLAKRKIYPCACETTKQSIGWAAQTCAQGCRSCWSTTEKDLRDSSALQYIETGDFICSSSIVWKKKRGRKIQSDCIFAL